MASRTTVPWLWVHCTDYLCGHSRAVVLAPWAIRWGVDNPGELIRRNFRCVMCDRMNAGFIQATMDHDGRTAKRQVSQVRGKKSD
jgi:hypothetical protein